MGVLSNMLFGAAVFMAIITGWYFGFSDLFQRTNVAMPTGYNTSVYANASSYMTTWNNQTQSALANAQAVPFFGGSFMLLTGVFQSLTLMVGMLPNVILPLIGDLSVQLGLPAWFVAFLTATVLGSILVGILNAMKGGQV